MSVLAKMNKFIVVNMDSVNNEASELFDTLDAAKEYISEEYDDDQVDDVVVYQVTKSFTVKSAGIELEEED